MGLLLILLVRKAHTHHISPTRRFPEVLLTSEKRGFCQHGDRLLLGCGGLLGVAALLGAFDFEDVEAELSKATLHRVEWAVLFSHRACLVGKRLQGSLDLCRGA